jgi:signal transduction histidine kinase/CheY-like chemotaxis protein
MYEQWRKVLTKLLWVFTLVMAGGLLYFQICSEGTHSFWTQDFRTMNQSWKIIESDGRTREINLPIHYDASEVSEVVIFRKLPEGIEDKDYLLMRGSRQDFCVWIGGEIRERYSDSAERKFGKTSASVYVIIPVSSDDRGKEIKITYTSSYDDYRGLLNEIGIGSQMGVLNKVMYEGGAHTIIAFIVLMVGILFGILGLGFRFGMRRATGFGYLGGYAVMSSGWILTQSPVRQLYFRDTVSADIIAYLLLLVIPIPLIMYFNEVQKGRHVKLHYGTVTVYMIYFVIRVVLQICNVVDLMEAQHINILLYIISIMLGYKAMLQDVRNGYKEEMTELLIGLTAIVMAYLIEAVYYTQNRNGIIGKYMSVGLVAFLVIMGYKSIKQMNNQEKKQREAIKANQAKSQFLANMSHEIRTPMNAVMGMSEIILQEDDLSDTVREQIMSIQSAGNTLLSIINDILDFSKIESGKMEIVPSTYQLSDLIYDVQNMIHFRMKDKPVEFIVDVDETIPDTLYGDEVRIRQILINLLGNAVKFTDEGSIVLKISWKKEEDTAWLTMDVVDTGIGIRQQDMSKMFESFQRVDLQINNKVEGTGLGLSICKQLCCMMDGDISVTSQYGKGSKFTAVIPQKIINQEITYGDSIKRKKANKQQCKTSESFRAPKVRVLVVDDNELNVKVAAGLMKPYQIQVDVAYSGREALKKIKGQNYQLIFLDHMMPQMDGIETLRLIKKEIKDFSIPVVALTANAIRGVEEIYLSKGFSDYLSKPIQPEKLLEILKKYIKNENIRKEKSKEDMLKEAIEALQEFDGERAAEIVNALYQEKQEENLSSILTQLEEFRYDEAEENLKYILDNNL